MNTPTAFAIGAAALYGAVFAPVPRFGRANYDPREMAHDGGFIAPRWLLHVQKIGLGIVVYAIVEALKWALESIDFVVPLFDVLPWIVAPAIVAFSALREVFAPTDPEPRTITEHATDWIADGCLYSGGVVLQWLAWGRWFAAAITVAVLVLGYRVNRNGARP